MPAENGLLLEVDGISASYGAVRAVQDVSLHLAAGETVTMVGANGAGKSTTLKCISGLLTPDSGRIRFDGQDLAGWPAYRVAELGIAHVPEGRRVFADLTVRENLNLGGYARRARPERARSLDLVMDLFPLLRERANQRAGTLSGGEQQMLAIGRSLMLRPKLLILDEPSLGLSPIMVETTYLGIAEIHRQGVTILLIEQNLHWALNFADRGYVLESGRVVLEGPARELLENPRIKAAYLGM
ncbi:MAG: ABC transporter ATP-binding protein [Chloroflexi bacterium]|nr:ABC transporter ATP-binding protein [Chloroflexota bacterium]